MNTDNLNEKHCNYNDFKRARYFDGELINKQIFITEQLYHNEKRKLLNKMLHGWGVVCGLKVKPTNPPGPNFIVERGMALDCNGNEILVCEEQVIDLTVKPCRPKPDKFSCTGPDANGQNGTILYVVIAHQEVNTDLVPAYASSGNCNCEEKTCDYSRTREGFCIEVWDKLPPTPKPYAIDTPCIETFPCPSSCCPDPHYIVLATISCGPRTDMLFSKCPINYKGDNQEDKRVEIRYQIKRSLPKVCATSSNAISGITDIYKFDPDRNSREISSWRWDINPADLKDNGISTNDPLSSSGTTFEIQYDFTAPKNAEGLISLKIPVSLSFFSDIDKVNQLDSCCLELPSPIYIGTTEPKLGSTISAAMIRNTENRQYAITFPLLSWLTYPLLSTLLAKSGNEDVQLSPGNLVSTFCSLIEKAFFPEDMVISTRVSRELEEMPIKEAREKQFEVWKAEIDKKIESMTKDVKTSAVNLKANTAAIEELKEFAKKQENK